MSQFKMFAAAPRGLEEVTAAELKKLGANDVKVELSGVSFTGDKALLYKANLWLRSASRVLVPIREFSAASPAMLYDQIRRIKWDQYLDPDMTFVVDVSLFNSNMTHSHFVALKAKDAIADELRRRFEGLRASVDKAQPDVKINLYVNNNRCVLSLDASGESLHKRGYRENANEAPLKENLAAALLLLAGYQGGPFYDPMCGSGTLVIEAAMIHGNIAPGLSRDYFGFQRWKDFDETIWKDVLREARQTQRFDEAPIIGSDRDRVVLDFARRNAKLAEVYEMVRLVQKDVLDTDAIMSFCQETFAGVESGVIVTNPPYGERMGEIRALEPSYKALGDLFKARFSGWNAFVLTGSPDLAKSVGLHASRRYPVFNGPIESRLLKFELYAGTRKKKTELLVLPFLFASLVAQADPLAERPAWISEPCFQEITTLRDLELERWQRSWQAVSPLIADTNVSQRLVTVARQTPAAGQILCPEGFQGEQRLVGVGDESVPTPVCTHGAETAPYAIRVTAVERNTTGQTVVGFNIQPQTIVGEPLAFSAIVRNGVVKELLVETNPVESGLGCHDNPYLVSMELPVDESALAEQVVLRRMMFSVSEGCEDGFFRLMRQTSGQLLPN